MKRIEACFYVAVWFVAGFFLISGCTELADFVAAVKSGGETIAPAVKHVPGAMAWNPADIVNIASYTANAALAAWGTWERRRRKRAITTGAP